MNQKGFTVVEMIISFALSMVIIIILFQMVLSLRSLFVDSGLHTQYLTQQAITTKGINEVFLKNTVSSVSNCGTNCTQFNFTNGTTYAISTNTDNNTLSYGEEVMEALDGCQIGVPVISNYTDVTIMESGIDSYYMIQIPYSCSLFPDRKYDIKASFLYDSRKVKVS